MASKLSEAARQLKNQYERERRAKRPGKAAESIRKYWEKKAAEQAEKAQ